MVRVGEQATPVDFDVEITETTKESVDRLGRLSLNRLIPRSETARKRLAFAGIIGALAAPTVFTAKANASPPMKYISVVENGIWSDNATESDQIASEAHAAGFKIMEIRQPASQYQKFVEKDDLTRLCNAADAVYQNGMVIKVTSQGFFAPNNPHDKNVKEGVPDMGYGPVTPEEIRNYKKYISSIMWIVGGPNRCTGLRHLSVDQMYLGIFNEPNVDTFWWKQDTAPQDYIRLLASTYTFIKKEEAKISQARGSKFNVTVIGGEWSSHDDPRGFLMRMKPAVQELRQAGYKGKFADMIAYHPYPVDTSEPYTVKHDNGFMGMADYDQLYPLLTDVLGYPPTLVYDEFGVMTKIPPELWYLYGGDTPEVMHPVDEITQAQYLNNAIGLAACQNNVAGVGLELLRDEPRVDGWHSGLEFANGKRKASFNPLSRTLKGLAIGMANCSPAQKSNSAIKTQNARRPADLSHPKNLPRKQLARR